MSAYLERLAEGRLPLPLLDEAMQVYMLNPLEDARWPAFLERHPAASVFHTPAWLEALRRTYGYVPMAFTTSPPQADLTDGMVACGIRSWLTGSRLVSLPFSDHCEPLVDRPGVLARLLQYLLELKKKEGWRYIELRPHTAPLEDQKGFGKSESFCLHKLDLRPSLAELFRGLHKDSIQRKVRRGEREALTYEEDRTEPLLRQFYSLLLLTRRRHQLPPQPFDWFRNLAESFGEKLKVRVASKDGQPVAAILTLSFRNSMVYKYGGSDEKFHNLGGMPLLFWRTIEDAKAGGAAEFDLGRTDCDNAGLITFKERLGAARLPLTYWRLPARAAQSKPGWKMRLARIFFSRLPDEVLIHTGSFLYRHIG